MSVALLLAFSLLLFCAPVFASISAGHDPQLSASQTTHCPQTQTASNQSTVDCLNHCALPAQFLSSPCITPLLSVQYPAPDFSPQLADLSPASPPPKRHS